MRMGLPILIFEYELHSYDFIYDCGMFHPLAPHRRLTYLIIIKKALKKDGYFGIVCFKTEGALSTPDWDIYNDKSIKGGIGYTKESLKKIFDSDFNIKEFKE
ncbi:methyltransferase type 12 [Ureibacillus aquaedulcis]|uniref:Methyltransferase type 12 n=1 Tax=Ureibacillus aquaedulcis TaxID=3058421 RepID=A0ABT8GMQ9_9BACL|nr:methyltransferase type 12 [Ureibacillus sp. BA0131]MDN4492539.1 methyltransferase type 12 [Ureibacillus sp. BA0131]